MALKYFEDEIGLKMCVIRNCPDYYYGFSNDSVAEGRLLEVLPFPAETLGEWQSRTRVSPLVPYGMTHADMFDKGGAANMSKWDFSLMAERLTKDERCLGAGLAAYFVKGVLDRGIPMHTGFNAEELIGDGARVVGVRATEGRQGRFVKANRGVVIAVSSYERNQNFRQRPWGISSKLGSMVFSTIDGANFRLAGPVGARIAKVPDITSLGFHVPGEEQENGEPLWRSALQPIGLPHTVVVNRMGNRFGNEASTAQFFTRWISLTAEPRPTPTSPAGQSSTARRGRNIHLVPLCPDRICPKAWVSKQIHCGARGKDRCGRARTCEPPLRVSTPMPRKARTRNSVAAPIRGAAGCAAIRIHKPHPNLGPLVKPPFYAVQLHRIGGSAIPSTGWFRSSFPRHRLGREAD